MSYPVIMKLRFLVILLLFLPLSAQAQNKIIVIGEDGKKQEVILDQPPVAAPIPKEGIEIKPKVIKSKPDTTTKKSEPKPLTLEDRAPVQQAAPKKPPSKPKMTQKAKPAPVKRAARVPYPPRKPTAEEVAKWVEDSKPVFDFVDPKNIPADVTITRDLAVRVALEVAPPSRGYDVFRMDYKGRPAYQIRFKTEGGPHDVLVDAQNGEVLKK